MNAHYFVYLPHPGANFQWAANNIDEAITECNGSGFGVKITGENVVIRYGVSPTDSTIAYEAQAH